MSGRFGIPDVALSVALVITIVLTVVLAYALLHEKEEKKAEITVEEVYFVVKAQTVSRTKIEIVLFISNIGESDIGSLSIRAFPVETDSNLAKSESSVVIYDVPSMKSAEGNLTIEVPNRDFYRVEILIFRDGKLDIRGSGTIDLTGVGIATDYRTYPDDGGSGGMALDEPADAVGAGLGGGCVLFLSMAFVVVIIVVIVLATRKKRPNEKGPDAEWSRPEGSAERKKDPDDEKGSHLLPEGMVPPDAYMDHGPEEEDK